MLPMRTFKKNKEQLCNSFKHGAGVVAYEHTQEKLPNALKEFKRTSVIINYQQLPITANYFYYNH